MSTPSEIASPWRGAPGRPVKRRPHALLWPAGLFAVLTLAAGAAYAHERFVKHKLKNPLHNEFFLRYPTAFLGMNPNMFRVAMNAVVVLALFTMVWFVRQPIHEFLDRRLARQAGGAIQRATHQLACFLTDRPVRSAGYRMIGEWAVIMFLRSPGLVLMYSATTDSLVMPSYPLDPKSAVFFKFAQALLAILILTQTLLPLCGALLLGTWLYLNRWSWMVAADALPVISVAVVYLTSPWESHKLAITEINENQLRWVRLTLGFGFLVLGWLKIYNHDLVIGVADNYPSVQNDPIVKVFMLGTDPRFFRECWVLSFGMAEILSGFMLMTGTFSRVWAAMMAFVFTKLMVVDFGWEEIPHIYPIGALLVVLFSNKLKSELDPIETIEERAGREGKTMKQAGIIIGSSIAIALIVVLPLLYALTFSDRSNL